MMSRWRAPLVLALMMILVSAGPLAAQVSGFVSDPELKPFIKAQVEFITPDVNLQHPRRSDVSSNGTFQVDPAQTHLFGLNFVAAYCEPQDVMIYLPKSGPLKLDVRLRPYSWVDDFKDIRVIGDFNGFSTGAGAVPLQALSDGTYFADVPNTIDGEMGYRLAGLVRNDSISVPGTHYDELARDESGAFVSKLTVKPGRVRILFDPSLLPRSFGKAEIIFDHPDSTTARVAAVCAGLAKRNRDYDLAASTFTAAGHDFKDFHYDWQSDVAKLNKELAQEKDDAVRQVLWIALLDLASLGSAEVDRTTAQKALAAIPPNSELWQIAGQFLLFDSIRLAGGLSRYRDYFEKVITTNPSRLVRAFALERAYLVARREKDLAKARQYYAMLTETYGDLLPGQRVKGMPPENK